MPHYNPFQNLELKIPESYRDAVGELSQTRPGGGAKPLPEDSPFERQIDLWFLAICIGARTKRRLPVSKKSHPFITGVTLATDPGRIALLQLLAISWTKDPWIIDKPSEIIDLANNLAAAGLPELIEIMTHGKAKPMWALTDHITDIAGPQ